MNRLAGSRQGRWATAILGVFALGAGAAASGVVTPAAALTLGAAGVAAAGLLAIAVKGFAFRLTALLVVVGLLGSLRGFVSMAMPGPGLIAGHLGQRSVVVIGSVRDGSSAAAVVVDAARIVEADSDTAVSGGVLVTGRNLPIVLPGDRVEVDAAGLKAAGGRPGPESEAALEREGVQAIAVTPQMAILDEGAPSPVRALAWLRARLVAGTEQALPQPAASLLLGIAFGIRDTLPGDVRGPLQDAGLIHIVVVSGLKVVIVISLVAAVAHRRGWSRRRTLLMTLPVVTGYVLLSGSGPAAVRSALMAGAAMLAGTTGRRTDPLPMLALVAALMVGVQPGVVRDVGFQLSFLGTLGIVLLAQPLARRLPGPRIVVEPFAVTVAAQLATVPVMAGSFGVIALAGPVANALVLPLLPLLILLGGAASLLGIAAPALAWLPMHVAALGADGIVLVSRIIDAIPGAAIRIGTWPATWTLAEAVGVTVAFALWMLLHHRRGTRLSGLALGSAAIAVGACATAVTALAAAGADGVLHVTVLDVGSATAVLLRTADGETALVDGGSSPTLLVGALGRVLPPTAGRIDLVVITGGEQTAVAGLAGLVARYRVGSVVVPVDVTNGAAAVLSNLQQAGADLVRAAGSWSWGGERWDWAPFRGAISGRDMGALGVGDASGRVLILGDAAAGDQEQLAAAYGSGLRADLMVSEPGGAISPLLLDAVRARALAVPIAKGAVAGAGLAALPASRTGVDGDLRYSGGASGLVRD